MPFIDTHLHLYTEEFNSDRNLALERAINNRINTLLLPNIDVESILPMKQLLRQFPKNCYGMMGLHPCSVKENYKEALAIIKQELYNEKYIAVGEIGTDLYWDKTTFTIQQDAFITQCQWALELNLPIAVHCRESVVETIDLVKQINKSNSQKLKGVFHCFSGSLEQAKELIDMDFYLGIGGVVTFKNGKIDKFLNQLPIERIVLETDSPYLAPVPHRGKRNEPAYIQLIAQKVADIYEKPLLAIEVITTQNAKKLFNLPVNE